MKKFFVLFCIPSSAIDEWMKSVDEATRKQQADEMMGAWRKWMEDHKDSIVEKGLPLGKTKRVTGSGVTNTRNDLNWYLIVKADSHDAAAEMFKNHPQLNIPSAYIEVLDASRPEEM